MYQKNLYDYLSDAVRTAPDKLAFADERTGYTYAQLYDRAEAIGSYLFERFGALNRPIAVAVERSADTLAAFFGVLASGNYYLPIDPHMPVRRMEHILAQVRPLCLITPDGTDLPDTTALCPTVLFSQAVEHTTDSAALCAQRAQVLDIDPAYIIFTSGSTGVPKGIVVCHRSVIDFTEWMSETFGFGGDDIFGNQAPFYFDLSVKDIYQTVKHAATCHIFPHRFFLFPKLLLEFAEKEGITAFIWATSAFHLVANSGALERVAPASLGKVILGGEALQAKQLNRWRRALPQVEYVNLYGPTEVTVDCTYYKIEREFADCESIPIGKVCENKQVLLLNEDLQSVPQGSIGEICVRGIGLALGYFGDREKTDAAFVQNPANTAYRDLIYRTGDLGKINERGEICFCARKDNQVKHMGYRIELAEIETVLSAVPGVDQIACIFDREKDRIIACYSGQAEESALSRAAAELLPKYMNPNVRCHMEQLPRTSNGKLDRNALWKISEHGTDC